MTTETLNGAIIDDKRTEQDKAETVGFVVATDSFMSGWGGAPNKSYFAVPFKTWEQADIVEANMRRRSEMKRVRVVTAPYKPYLKNGDHLSIRDFSDCSRFYKVNGF